MKNLRNRLGALRIFIGAPMRLIAPIFLVAPIYLFAFSSSSTSASVSPFALLIGNWGGSGLMVMEGGEKERLACDAKYGGGAAQLELAIHCVGGERNIRMQARLSANSGRLRGFWDEKYFMVAGMIAGTATENRINFTISGAINGNMTVDYSRSRQQVSISTRGVPLQSVKINMTRR